MIDKIIDYTLKHRLLTLLLVANLLAGNLWLQQVTAARGRKSQQDGVGYEIEQIAHAGDAHGDLDGPHHEGQEKGQLQIDAGAGLGDFAQGAEHHQGNGGGRPRDEVGRTAPQAADDRGIFTDTPDSLIGFNTDAPAVCVSTPSGTTPAK